MGQNSDGNANFFHLLREPFGPAHGLEPDIPQPKLSRTEPNKSKIGAGNRDTPRIKSKRTRESDPWQI
jgi:hypothetical protein